MKGEAHTWLKERKLPGVPPPHTHTHTHTHSPQEPPETQGQAFRTLKSPLPCGAPSGSSSTLWGLPLPSRNLSSLQGPLNSHGQALCPLGSLFTLWLLPPSRPPPKPSGGPLISLVPSSHHGPVYPLWTPLPMGPLSSLLGTPSPSRAQLSSKHPLRT